MDSFDELFDPTSNKSPILTEAMEKLNNEWAEVEKIMQFTDEDKNDLERSGLVRKDISAETYKQLMQVAPDFIDLDSQVNMRPKIKDIYEFCLANPEFVMECQFVWPERSDYRIEPEGLYAPDNGKARNKLNAFIDSVQSPDVSEPDEHDVYDGNIRAWWD